MKMSATAHPSTALHGDAEEAQLGTREALLVSVPLDRLLQLGAPDPGVMISNSALLEITHAWHLFHPLPVAALRAHGFLERGFGIVI